MKKILFFLLLLFPSLLLLAQKKEKEKEKTTQVELVQARSLKGSIVKGQELRKLIGEVIFKHEGALLYCDSSYWFEKKNEIECFGNVRMVQGDSITLTGKKLFYNGNTRKAIVTKDVVLQDRKMTLTTDYLDYDTKNKLATYQGGGKIINGADVLTSKRGYYNTASKIFWFKKDVKLVNEVKKYTLVSDTLQYHSISKIATFRGPSKVTQEKDVLYADHGEYNTKEGRSRFTGRAKVESGSYILEGDKIHYDELRGNGIAEGNVEVTSLENNIIVFGDLAHYWGKDGVVRIVGNPLVKNQMEDDTLFLVADTLISIDRKNPKDTTIKEKYLQAFHNVKIFKTDIQAKCDSLIYNFVDSTIYLYTDPVMWNGGNQIVADSINILMKNKKIYKMNTNVNSFIVSQDTIKHFNQVKGRKMTAFFHNDKLSRVDVTGNGQSLYYAMEEGKTNLIGLNKADCSNIVIKFKNGDVKNISYINKPDAKFIPPHLILEPDTRLGGFKWRIEEKPLKEDVVNVRNKKEVPVQIPYRPDYKPEERKSEPEPESKSKKKTKK
jgi:lipopolysaccharide export system protein LptA